MELKVVQCPICTSTGSLECRENQTVYRCPNCSRMVRMITKDAKKKKGKEPKHANK